jgi:hypothetical protein
MLAVVVDLLVELLEQQVHVQQVALVVVVRPVEMVQLIEVVVAVGEETHRVQVEQVVQELLF